MIRLVFVFLFLLVLSACQTGIFKSDTPSNTTTTEKQKSPPPADKPVAIAAPTPTAPAKPVVHEKKDPEPAPVVPIISKKSGDAELRDALQFYANGDYEAASKRFDTALSLGLAKRDDRVKAYKHLAFIACAKDQQTACRYYFRNMLLVNPKADLSPAEAGHPAWGPVFIQIKQEVRDKK